MRWCVVVIPLVLAACDNPVPDLPALSPTARQAPPPVLVPLGPLLAEVDALPPRDAAAEDAELKARARDLRRRARDLRHRPL
ncbi:MAG: hypothetical protein GDA52_10525 [Rhodobacteraceae bacterium]|nr:hypothetical protein [Paracoccaceae bacterium]